MYFATLKRPSALIPLAMSHDPDEGAAAAPVFLLKL
jgi:hypothetical protein